MVWENQTTHIKIQIGGIFSLYGVGDEIFKV